MIRDTFRAADGCVLSFVDEGEGRPVLWQHGLGADQGQPAEVFPHNAGLRRITLECRGHGRSELGDPSALSIARFADDALALLDHLGVARVAVGGISLGAAIALRLAALHPARVTALVLARPAWVDDPAPETLRIYAEVGALLATHGPVEGRRLFEASPLLGFVEAVSPDNAASLRGFFAREPRSTAALLTRIPLDGPGIARDAMRALRVSTLVVGNDHDFVHPLGTARTLATLIPGAAFREITSKTVDRTRYIAEFQAALREGLGT